jgi:hypothetical protein
MLYDIVKDGSLDELKKKIQDKLNKNWVIRGNSVITEIHETSNLKIYFIEMCYESYYKEDSNINLTRSIDKFREDLLDILNSFMPFLRFIGKKNKKNKKDTQEI